MPARADRGIEAIIAARRGNQVPSRDDLRTRTSALVMQHNSNAHKGMGEVMSMDDAMLLQGRPLTAGGAMSVEELQEHCDEILNDAHVELPPRPVSSSPSPALAAAAEARSGGSLLAGSYDEVANAEAFAQALADFRNAPATASEPCLPQVNVASVSCG